MSNSCNAVSKRNFSRSMQRLRTGLSPGILLRHFPGLKRERGKEGEREKEKMSSLCCQLDSEKV